jgi:hypothetical protein
MDGADDLAAVDALQINAGDAEVRVSQLALDHDQGNSLVSHLDSVSMSKLVRREATANAGAGGRMVQLFAGS